MKAAQYHKLGDPSVFQFDDVPDPSPKDHEVLIQVAYASVNHTDIHFRRGIPGMSTPLPHIPGSDASGIIQDKGSKVTNLNIGDRVYLNPTVFCKTCSFCTQGKLNLCKREQLIGRETQGSYAQYLCVSQEQVYPIPDSFDLALAAAAPLVYQTAYAMMVTKAKLCKGETVLVMGAGSGVGMACIQIAKKIGAHVITTASTEKKCAQALDMLQADHVIRYTSEDLRTRIKEITKKQGVDVVIDHVGGRQWVALLQSLQNGGRLITCGATNGYDPKTDLRHIFFRQLNIMGSTMATPEELDAVMQWVFDGSCTPIIDQTFALKDAARAHQYIEDRNVFGKVLLAVDPDID